MELLGLSRQKWQTRFAQVDHAGFKNTKNKDRGAISTFGKTSRCCRGSWPMLPLPYKCPGRLNYIDIIIDSNTTSNIGVWRDRAPLLSSPRHFLILSLSRFLSHFTWRLLLLLGSSLHAWSTHNRQENAASMPPHQLQEVGKPSVSFVV